ncbi:Heat shock protein STI1 [Tolypocladium paradoxum]|uniref:Heat shock protein STI1 n=1 Tax=Tolypocladium paradoxum TaxID=94208 RepID=A0A2S4KN70_9HYPO|nr:Heat shock protein STI1 [Tolypocladium paradoxum]
MGAFDEATRGEHCSAAARPAAPTDWSIDATWSSIPTNLLLQELRRREEGGEKPQCGSRQTGWYDTVAHIFALLLILVLSTLACGLPLISRRTTTGKRQRTIIFYCQHVGTGVLLATAFVHLLPTAFQSLTDPCLPYFFSKGYTPLPGLVAMVSAIVVVGVESFLTARGAGHSHSHAHDFFDQTDGSSTADGHFHEVDLNDDTGGLAGRRMGGHRPAAISLEDMEATQGLVAGVSPLPESTPTTAQRRRKSTDQELDGDSDLDLDMDELDPASVNGNRNGPYAPLKPGDGGSADPGIPPHTPEEHQRKLLQCLLLEAGILFHSVFIGMAISVATGPAFVVFLVAISFHQFFEGLALGSRIGAVQFPKNSIRPWLMVLAYGITTPLGQAIGLIVHKMYDPASMGGLLVVGFMNAVSSGLLLYAGLVQLLAEDFLTEKSYKILKGKKRLHAYLAVVGGAVLMALVGAFA